MSDIINNTKNIIEGQSFKPSEIIKIFEAHLAKQSVNAQVVHLRGIYIANGKQQYGGYFYDTLKDEDRQEEITLLLTKQQRENLKNGNLVCVGGILGRNISYNGFIKLVLNVSRIEIMQEQVVDMVEIKRMELRQKKGTIGFKNVDNILEQLLYIDQRPKVALIFAHSSITMSDFQAGINASKSAIDFEEFRVNFSNSQDLIDLLFRLDNLNFDIISIVRGGGAGIEKLDEISVLEAIIKLETPTVAAIGHVEEKLFIKQLVDKSAPTPNGLGQYFSELVESVSEKKSKSRAVITEQIKKQFKEQLEAGQKQNKELQDKLSVLTKIQVESTKKHNEQVKEAQKQNEELQKKLSEITKSNENSQKGQSEVINKLQAQMKEQTENYNKQQQDFNISLKKLQETNAELNKNIFNLTTQNANVIKELNEVKDKKRELEKRLNGEIEEGFNVWKVVTIVAIIIIIYLLFR